MKSLAGEAEAKQNEVEKGVVFLCFDWLGTVRYENTHCEAKRTNQRAALKRCWSTVPRED